MPHPIGHNTYISIGEQKSQGTPVPANIPLILSSPPSIKPHIDRQHFQVFQQGNKLGAPTDFRITSEHAGGSIECPAYPRELYYLFYGVLGYSSMLSPDITANSTLPFFTMDHVLDNVSQFFGGTDDVIMRYKDMVISKTTISGNADDTIKLSADVLGRTVGIVTDDAEPTVRTDITPFSGADVSITLGGSANCDISEFDLTVDRHVKTRKTFCATNNIGDNHVYPTTLDVSGSFTMHFDNTEEYSYWLGSKGTTNINPKANKITSGRNLQIKLDQGVSNVNTYNINIPIIAYQDSIISTPYDDLLTVKFDFKAYVDATQNNGKELISIQRVFR